MRQLWVVLYCLCTLNVFAQYNSFGIHGTQTEYMGDLNDNAVPFYGFKFPKSGIGFSLQQYLSPQFNLVEKLSFDQLKYQNPLKTNGVEASLTSFNVFLKYKFNNDIHLAEDAWLAPFFVLGVGFVQIDSKKSTEPVVSPQKPIVSASALNAAFGGGLTIRLSKGVSIELASTIYQPFNDEWDGLKRSWNNDMYLQHSIGLLFNYRKNGDSDKDGVKDKKDKCPNTPLGTKVDADGCPLSLDDDGDGVLNQNDRCPNTPKGTVVNAYGCAESVAKPVDGDDDGDGVPNSRDLCKHTPPNTRVDYFGCPFDSDSDGDGVPDDRDRCPNTPPGTKVGSNGCPEEADNDRDGLPNSRDRCPDSYGPANNRGCPEVKAEAKKQLEYAVHGIHFETGKFRILPDSYEILDKIVGILGEYPDYTLRMGGHTDDVGSDASNNVLSQKRVDAVKKYFVQKGINSARIEATGYGESKPIATNKTVEGRSQNRRVELDLFLK